MILSMLKTFLIIIGIIAVVGFIILCCALCMIQTDDSFHDNSYDEEQW